MFFFLKKVPSKQFKLKPQSCYSFKNTADIYHILLLKLFLLSGKSLSLFTLYFVLELMTCGVPTPSSTSKNLVFPEYSSLEVHDMCCLFFKSSSSHASNDFASHSSVYEICSSCTEMPLFLGGSGLTPTHNSVLHYLFLTPDFLKLNLYSKHCLTSFNSP